MRVYSGAHVGLTPRRSPIPLFFFFPGTSHALPLRALLLLLALCSSLDPGRTKETFPRHHSRGGGAVAEGKQETALRLVTTVGLSQSKRKGSLCSKDTLFHRRSET